MNVRRLIDDSFLDKQEIFLRSTGGDTPITVSNYTPFVEPYNLPNPILWTSVDYSRGTVITIGDKDINEIGETQQFIKIAEAGQYQITYNIHLEKPNTFFTDIYHYILYLSPNPSVDAGGWYIPSSKSCAYFRFEEAHTQTMIQYTTIETLEAGSGIQLKVLPYKSPAVVGEVIQVSAGAGGFPNAPIPSQVKAEIFVSKL